MAFVVVKRVFLAFAVLCVIFPGHGWAASFSVNPVLFTLTAKRGATSMQIVNHDQGTIRLQVRALAWGTDGREETLVDTDDIVLNPPYAKLEPGQSQIIRFGLRKPHQPEIERGYRLIIEEIADTTSPAVGIRTLLRVSVPVFIEAAQAREQVVWSALKQDGTVVLTAANRGTVHSKVLKARLATGECGRTAVPTFDVGPSYILPGQTKRWDVSSDKAVGDKACLVVNSATGQRETLLAIQSD